MSGSPWITILLLAVLVLLGLCCYLLVKVLVHVQASRSIMKNTELQENARNEVMMKTLQNSIQNLSSDTVKNRALNERMEESMREISAVMTNAKRRGSWGEYQLESLLRLFVGSAPGVMKMQYTLSNGRIADCAFSMPETGKVLCIDSKFPMENYLRFLEAEPEEEAAVQKEFERNVRKHIDDIANKYVLPGETAEFAVMFLPSESLYEFICGECFELTEYAMTKHVVLAGPTTLSGIVFTLLGTLRDVIRKNKLDEIEKELTRFEEDIDRLCRMQENLSRSVNQVNIKNRNLKNGLESLKVRYARLTGLEQNDSSESGLEEAVCEEDETLVQ